MYKAEFYKWYIKWIREAKAARQLSYPEGDEVWIVVMLLGIGRRREMRDVWSRAAIAKAPAKHAERVPSRPTEAWGPGLHQLLCAAV